MVDLSGLNPAQREAVICTEGPLVVLAGAGSGKTRVITHRIAYLLELGVPAERIVAVTFTNKAAGEMRDRLAKMVGSRTAKALVLGTFHSIGAAMMRSEPETFGLDAGSFSILDQGDVLGIVRGLLREHGHHGADDRRFDVAGVTQRIGLWKNAFFTAAQLEREIVDEYDVVAAAIYDAYEDRLRSLGSVDFDDLVCLVASSLARNDEARERWRGRFDYLLVDEYQDTNTAQFEMLAQLCGPPHNLCVVGDDDQAIYGWRGAKIENILSFTHSFPAATTVKLEQNYRSRAPILECANAVVRNNQNRNDKTLIPTRRGGEPVDVVVAADSDQEAQWVGRQIRKLVVEDRRSADEVAVLYRSASQGKAIEEQLQLHGIRYRVLGGQSVYDKKEIKDALAYLKTIVTPRDELALRRALETPPRGIGRQSIELLKRHAAARGVSLQDAVHHSHEVQGLNSRAQNALSQFSAMIRRAQQQARAEGSAATALRGVLDEIGFRDHVRREIGSDGATEARMSGVEWLAASVERYEQRRREAGAKPQWSSYFGTVSLDSSSNDPDAEAAPPTGEVTLSTLHSAKGLEWEFVFLVGVEEGTMPHRRVAAPRISDAIAGDLEEERRLFYVGITRARERLWLTRGAARLDRGRELPRAPSRFLDELPPEFIRPYEIAKQEELSSDAIGDMAAAFLAMSKPEEPAPTAKPRA
ncbi:MAG: UvrD-helicase domain-containing protein [Deltaproteobacteria bacterium]|nr:UvrD-helicase domain-containing protein [Deltaproteobacteria bacterium]MBK8239087.1 UvrD-helicase domain-containing protein [Deltaproteobacteria bacterium]